MKLLRTFDELPAHSSLAIGVFDGVHLGHQRVITTARDAGSPSVVLTFDPHPMRVLRPEQAPALLTSTEHKLRLIEKLGVDACLLLTFDKQLAETSAEDFVRMISSCRQVCVGSRFRFGHDRQGDVRLMQQRAQFIVKEIPSVTTADGEVISSTAVRQHVVAGHLERAAEMLGRRFSVLGTVEHGDHRGHELGFATANVNPHNEVLPPDGVYAVRTSFGPGVTNIGMRPTFAGKSRRLEVHIFNFDEKLYAREIEVDFVRKLRDERKFASVDELKSQIAADVQAARAVLSS